MNAYVAVIPTSTYRYVINPINNFRLNCVFDSDNAFEQPAAV